MMLIRTLHVSTTAAAASFLIGSLGLAGCTSGSNVTVTHNPALTTSGGRATARSITQAAVLAADTSNGLALPGGPTPASLARLVRDVSHGRRLSATGAATGTCTNGTKQSQVTNSDGSVSTTTDLFYEATCVTLESETIVKVLTSGTASTTATGTITDYDKTANVLGFVTLTMSQATASNVDTITLQESAATTVAGTATAQLGATCTGAPNAVTLSCSIAHFGTSSGTTTGETMADAATAGASGANASETVAIAFSLGIGLSLTQPTTTTWSVSGASAFNSASGTYGYATTGSTGNGTMTLKDVLYTYTTTATLSPTGLSVTTVEGSTPISTASIDAAGVGTLNYADGTSEPIAAGFVGV